MAKLLAIFRDERFSPNSVGKDWIIMQSVIECLRKKGREFANVEMIGERFFEESHDADIYISMGRLPRTLEILKEKERKGCRVVNRPEAVEACCRSNLDRIMRLNHIPMPPSEGQAGYWIKRGDESAQTACDVVFCKNDEALEEEKLRFANRGITDYVVSAHMVGDLVKFYAVSDGFFFHYYPTDERCSKFGNEVQNGVARHYAFSKTALAQDAARLAKLVGIEVYGGDAIIDRQGNYYIIDFNDWPSFSRCRDNAAASIANIIANEQF